MSRPDSEAVARAGSVRGRWSWWLFALTLAWYCYTLTPSLAWADGARLQIDVMLRGSTYWFFDEIRAVPTDGWPFERLGVAAWDHPLYVMLGQLMRLLPWGEPAWRITLLSALAGALAIVLLARIALVLNEQTPCASWAAVLGALALAISHTFWFHAVTPEVYTLHAVFMTGLLALALRWRRTRRQRDLLLLALLAGLGCANHLMLALTLLPTLIFVGAEYWRPSSPVPQPNQPPITARLLLSISALFVLGFVPWWVQCLRMMRVGGAWLTLSLATGLPWLPRRMPQQLSWTLANNLGAYGGFLLYQFTPVGVALGGYGIVRLWRTQPRIGRLLLALFTIHMLFSANYSVADRFAFHLPSYLIFALFIAAGWAGLLGSLSVGVRRPALAGALALTLAPIALYAITPRAVRALGLSERDLGIAPIGTGARDTLAYFFDPNQRGDDSAARFGRSTLAQLPPQALIFTAWPDDQEAYLVLRYVQAVERQRPDVRLDLLLFAADLPTPERALAVIRAEQFCRPLYLASLSPALYPLDQLRADFTIVPEANLYRLLPRRPTASTTCQPTAQQRQLTLEQLIRSALR